MKNRIKTRMNTQIKALVVVALLAVSSSSFAEWTVNYSGFAKKYIVSDGNYSIQYNTEKSAKKAAKAINKAEKKEKKNKKGKG